LLNVAYFLDIANRKDLIIVVKYYVVKDKVVVHGKFNIVLIWVQLNWKSRVHVKMYCT